MKNNPLTEKDRQEINAKLKQLDELQERIQAAKDAGVVGADEYGRRCEYCRDNLVKVKQTYFKGKP